MKECFVVTPIGTDGSDIRKRADKVFKYIIDPVCIECGFNAIRVDQINQSDSITQTIIDYLNNAELVIADMSGHNPNAFYEMGFRACTGKPMINLREKGEGIPFDISTIRAFEYDLSDLDSVDEVKRRLEQTINSFNIEEDNEELAGSLEHVETDNNESEKGVARLLPVLYEIQDQITSLKEDIHNKDTEMIQAIIKASNPPTPAEDPNTVLMKILLPEMIKNPDSFKKLMELSENVQKNDRKRK